MKYTWDLFCCFLETTREVHVTWERVVVTGGPSHTANVRVSGADTIGIT